MDIMAKKSGTEMSRIFCTVGGRIFLLGGFPPNCNFTKTLLVDRQSSRYNRNS